MRIWEQLAEGEVGVVVDGVGITGGRSPGGAVSGNGVIGRCLSPIWARIVGGNIGVEFPENDMKRRGRSVGRSVSAVTPHSVIAIGVGMELHRVVIIVGTKVVTHRFVAVCIGTGTTRGVGGTVIGAVSVLQTTTRVGAI